MAAHVRDVRGEALDLERAQRHPDPIAPGQQPVLSRVLQAAEVAPQHRLDLALEPPVADMAGAVGRYPNFGPWQRPAVDDPANRAHSGPLGGSGGGGMSWNSIDGMCWIKAVGSPGVPGSS